MSLSTSHFLSDLYDQHIEEAAFLYDFLRASILEPDFQWIDAREFEDRREAHIDALVIGDYAALACCLELANDGVGELYVYASVILRQGRTDELADRLLALELRSPDTLDALTMAIMDHADASQLNRLSSGGLDACCSVTLLAISRAMERRENSMATPTLRKVLFARLNAVKTMSRQGSDIRDEEEEQVGPGLFGTVPGSDFTVAQMQGLESKEDWLRDESIFNLQASADASQQHLLRHAVESGAGGHAAFMTSAGADYAQTLITTMQAAGTLDVIHALAISGLPEAVRPLVRALYSELAEVAATALFCITGAQLMESVFEEEEIEEDELFDNERASFLVGEKPKRVDGSAFGEERSRISVDPERWKQWLKNNKTQFSVATRYRLGEAISPDSLVRVLRREDTPNWLRSYTAKELRCRYGVTAPFHVSLCVRHQLPCLLAMRKSVDAMPPVVAGKWYLGGRLMVAGG